MSRARARKGSSTFEIRVPIQARVGLRSSASWAKEFFGTESSLEPAWVTKLSAYSRRMPKFLSHAQRRSGWIRVIKKDSNRIESRYQGSKHRQFHRQCPLRGDWWKKWWEKRCLLKVFWKSSGLAIVYQDWKTEIINSDNCASGFLW